VTGPSASAVQRSAGVILGLVVVLLLANSLFLVTAQVTSELVAGMVRAHLGLGAVLLVALPVFVWSHVRVHAGHPNQRARAVGRFVAGLAGLGAVTGLALWALEKQAALRWLVLAHEGAFVGAMLAYGLHRVRAYVTPALAPERAAALLAAVLVGGLWAMELTSAPGERPVSPAFEPGLSQAATVSGHQLTAADLNDTDYCAQCHEAIAERWQSSTHRHGSLNDPFYAATLALAQQHRTPDQLAFCGACHDPVLLFTGRMAGHPLPEDPDADAGITCLVCHDIAREPGRLGNGSYVLRPPAHYPQYGSEDAAEQEENRRLIRSKPGLHRTSFAPGHLRSSELCIGCHKAHIPPELNAHRWLAGQNDYDPWFDSGAGGHSARTFYPPKPEQLRCQDCHMPRIAADDPAARDGKVADHAFLGANTALPAVLGDDEWLARNAEFLQGIVTVDIGAVESIQGRVLAPGDRVSVPRDEEITLDVVVRNTGSGHLFPGGVADLREAWLEVTLESAGAALSGSGWVDASGRLDPMAYRWNAVLLDRDGRHLTRHEVEDAYVVLASRRIMLGASDVVRVQLPRVPGPARLTVRVMHRKFSREYVEFTLGADAPPMPVHALASAALSLTSGPWDAPEATSGRGPRLRNLGIAHLLRGDSASAREASSAAALLLPHDPGPPLDLARAALADGDLDGAEAQVRAADALHPGHPTGAWLLGRIRAAQGRHDEALAAYDVALASFPRDRQVKTLRADALYRLERDAEAETELEQVLAIDPEHLAAHSLLARILSERGDVAGAERHRQSWERFRPRSDDRVVTETARRADPALDQRARQQVLLRLGPVPAGAAPADRWAAGTAD